MLKNGKVFGKYNVVDFTIFVIIFIIVVGFLFVKTGLHRPIGKISKGAKPIEFTITTRAYDVSSTEEIMEQGDTTFITIRNVPYTKLEIKEVKKEHVQEMFFNYDRPEVPYLINNVAFPNRYIYIVTVKDKAQITSDGAVVGGNKIKIGLPVDIEGFNYRLSGMVSDVKVIDEEEDSEAPTNQTPTDEAPADETPAEEVQE